ncbi:MAG: type VI secretion system protein IglI family protein [Methylococcaceae bacterium]
MSIELLQGRLPVTENPGLDSTDPRLDEIATLSQAGKYTEAAALSEALLADGIYDIRLIGFFLFGYWLEYGLTSILTLIDCLNTIILDNWPAIGPVSNRNKNLEKSLNWLFRQILKKIHYEENKNTSLWQQWQASASAVDVDKILESGETFRFAINQQLEDKAGAVVDQWSKIEKWLLTFRQLAYCPPEPVQAESEQSADDHAPTTAFKTVALDTKTSYPLALLLKKLAAFEQVLEENKFPQAALLADDINQTLYNFDPKLYFPKLFETFVRLQVLNFETLIVYADQREDPQWQAMQEWLKVDIDSFIKH